MTNINELTDWLTFVIWTNQQFEQHTQKNLTKKQYKKEFKQLTKIKLTFTNN